jgi:hypothetical protein
MIKFIPAMCWAVAMLILATGAKLGWVDRDAATTLMLVMPILAFITIQRRHCCALRDEVA